MNDRIRLSKVLAALIVLVLIGIGGRASTASFTSSGNTFLAGLQEVSLAGTDSRQQTQFTSQHTANSTSYRNSPANITWRPARNMSNNPGANEPAAAMHPDNPMLVLSGGNKTYPFSGVMINNSTDGGDTWQRTFPQPAGLADGVMAWLPRTINGGLSALNTQLASSPDDLGLILSKTTDGGTTWAAVTDTNIHVSPFSDDRPYFWTDHNPISPYYGRIYLTQTLFRTVSYNGISVRWTTDEGTTWSPHTALVDTGELARLENNNQFASLAIQPSGAVVATWRRGKCCGSQPQINVPNKVMWSRSTDGGSTFPISGTITTVPLEQSLSFNSRTPGGFPWTDAPTVAADPVDGTLYAVWVAFRQPNMSTTAAVYLSRGAPDGSTWTTPVVVDNSQPNRFQYMPWVQVSADRVVHVAYSAAVSSDTSLAHFYLQSTDRGETFSTPFMISDIEFPATSFMGDYQASSIGAGTGGNASIIVTWTDTRNGEENQWGRVGTLSLTTSTPTSTATTPASPTITSTSTAVTPPTMTSTPTRTRTATIVPPTDTPVATPTLASCPIQFSDVDETNTFYTNIRCLACQGIVSGYSDGTFKPNNPVTRGQLAKMVSNSAGFTENPNPQIFADVGPTHTFYEWTNRLTRRGHMTGYECGGPGEPCINNMPYFRPFANATRGQTSKIVSNAAGFTETPTGQTFQDVPPTHTFYAEIQRLASRNVMQGYECGGPFEPCIGPENKPYFRSGNDVTRGQSSKIVANAFFPGCDPAARP